jgi:hypothetical protein
MIDELVKTKRYGSSKVCRVYIIALANQKMRLSGRY